MGGSRVSRNEDIHNGIWDDPDFEALGPYATLLYLWSFTNPRCGMAGTYKVSHVRMTESKVPLDEIPGALAELQEARFAFYQDGMLWVRSRVKRITAKSKWMAKAVVKDFLRNVPETHPLHGLFMGEYRDAKWLRDAWTEATDTPSTDGVQTVSENPIGKGDSHTVSIPSTDGTRDRASSSSSSTEDVDLPENFPRELLPHLRVAFRVLRDFARRQPNAKAVSPRALANVVMGHAHKPIVRAAYDCVAHFDGKPGSRRDIVATYRNWLDRTDDLEGFETLGPSGLPSGIRTNGRGAGPSPQLPDAHRPSDDWSRQVADHMANRREAS